MPPMPAATILMQEQQDGLGADLAGLMQQPAAAPAGMGDYDDVAPAGRGSYDAAAPTGMGGEGAVGRESMDAEGDDLYDPEDF